MNPCNPALDRTLIVIPTYHAAAHLPALCAALNVLQVRPQQVLFIDSSSADATQDLIRRYGAQLEVIPQSQFNHGGTRRRAVEMTAAEEFLIFLTQDALPTDAQAFDRILRAFENPRVGMAYGRQLPRSIAGAIERHARLMNYPADVTETRSLADRARLGAKTVFSSNSFAAYRRAALLAVGNFPEDAIFAEDQITAGRMLVQGWQLAYVGNACVVHSHGYTITQEFRRYFDVGVFHARNAWLLETFGRAEGEGLRFVRSELRYLLRHQPFAIPGAWLRTLAKYLGYRLGRLEARLSRGLKRRLSMSPYYWKTARGS
jgi:rhamnosyltransferase